ncbi:uncharacterized protein ARMOST_08713 [Armillaria ostoyae]|uniref:Uncharacterized protein n=1 Tax=Armillaria ostoyae TaxID=47428 RepID=A0A284R9G3_ARMOS|nr:uncharacterized protein ARMOST_08713 [Armillaria ostoyae]
MSTATGPRLLFVGFESADIKVEVSGYLLPPATMSLNLAARWTICGDKRLDTGTGLQQWPRANQAPARSTDQQRDFTPKI